MPCETDEVDGSTGSLHGYTYLVAPRLPTGIYRVDIIDPHGNLFAIEGDTEQSARDRAEGWIEKRVADALWYSVMRQKAPDPEEQLDRYDMRDVNDQESFR